MNHRTVFRCVVYLAIFLSLVAVLAALMMGAGAPMKSQNATGPMMTPHPIDESFSDCQSCHAIGGDSSMPLTHASFSQETCLTCHPPQ